MDDVYRQIPPVDCRGQCLESCGPISMSRQEQGKLLAQGINIPPMAEAIAALEKGEDYYCPALIEGALLRLRRPPDHMPTMGSHRVHALCLRVHAR